MTHGIISQAIKLADPDGVKSSYTYSFSPQIYTGFTVSALTDTANSSNPYTISSTDFYDASTYESNVAAGFTAIAGAAGVSFSYVNATAIDSADIMIYGLDKTFYNIGTNRAAGAFTVGPSVNSVYASDVYLGSLAAMTSGGLTLQHSISHELQHSVGLLDLAATALSGTEYDDGRFSIMSFNVNSSVGHVSDELQLYDIASLQYLYGSAEQNAGDTTYSSFADSGGVRTFAIWDSGGWDAIDTSAQSDAALIDLRPGYFSSIGAGANVVWDAGDGSPSVVSEGMQNVSIAFGAYIEDAIGSDHNDILIGNQLDNDLYGGAGDDLIFGDGTYSLYDAGAGDYRQISAGSEGSVPQAISDYVSNPSYQYDYIEGGDGNDYIVGGQGYNDIHGGFGSDIIEFYGNGTGDINGDEGNDLIKFGAGRDYILQGGDGNDIIIGGDGCVINGGSGDDVFFLEKMSEGNICNIEGADADGALYWNGYRILGGQNMVLDYEISDDGLNGSATLGNMDANGIQCVIFNGHLIVTCPDGGEIDVHGFTNGMMGINVPDPAQSTDFEFTYDDDGTIIGHNTSLQLSDVCDDGAQDNWHDISGLVAALNTPGPFAEPTMYLT